MSNMHEEPTADPIEEIPALDDLDGDELHKEEFMGEYINPDEDPNLTEHHDA